MAVTPAASDPASRRETAPGAGRRRPTPGGGPAVDPGLLNGDDGPRWANLGDWSAAGSYPEAAEALATRLGVRGRLAPGVRVVDVGVGTGEQLLHWERAFGVEDITGFEPATGRLREARRRVAARARERGAAGIRVRHGDHTLTGCESRSADRVLALDSAYHFDSRQDFFRAARRVLAPGGRLALTDLVAASSPPPRAFRRWSSRIGIPQANGTDEARYRAILDALGFDDVAVEDRTEAVLGGFARWVARRPLRLLREGWGRGGGAVLATGLLAAMAVRGGWARYVVVTARRAA